MENYISTIITLSILGGVVVSLISEKSSLKKHINMILSLICVIVLLSPITNLILNKEIFKASVNKFFDQALQSENIENSNKIIVSNSIKSIESGISSTLIDKFSLDERDLSVKILCDTKNIEDIKIKEIEIVLTNKASWANADAICKYIKNLTGIEVNVIKR